MTQDELQKKLDILKKVSPWKFKVPRLKKGEIPLERVTGKKALDYFKIRGYKSARIGPTVMFRNQRHYTIIVSIKEFFKKQDEMIKSMTSRKHHSKK